MSPWSRRATAPDTAAAGPSAGDGRPLVPLVLGELLVEVLHLPARRAKRPPKTVVQFSVGPTRTLMQPQEVRALIAGKVGIIDSCAGGSDAFLCDAAGVAAMATAGKPSEAGKWMAVFPPEALALVTGPAIDDPAVVINAADKALLEQWLAALAPR
ncbi:hypothetical protein ACFUCV_10015 [Specibacter sp. NPDC057265]|uniref:hypothetical protein n=1 Tax=Specibacter sp. NPDC057265 TaxID=3346075 RepID=UPI003629569F